MDRLSREREETLVRPPEPAPEPTRGGSLDWASAVGNQAVQRLARQAMEPEAETALEEPEAEEGPPPEVEQLEVQGIGMDAIAGLAAVDELAEDELPQ